MVWFGMVWYGFDGIVWYGVGGGGVGGQITSEFINEEISMLFCSEKFSGGWWVETSNYSYKLQVQVSYWRFEIPWTWTRA